MSVSTGSTVAEPSDISVSELRQRLTACGVPRVSPSSALPLLPAGMDLGLHEWFVLQENREIFAIVDLDGAAIRWMVLSPLNAEVNELVPGATMPRRLGFRFSARAPATDLGHFLATFDCGGAL